MLVHHQRSWAAQETRTIGQRAEFPSYVAKRKDAWRDRTDGQFIPEARMDKEKRMQEISDELEKKQVPAWMLREMMADLYRYAVSQEIEISRLKKELIALKESMKGGNDGRG